MATEQESRLIYTSLLVKEAFDRAKKNFSPENDRDFSDAWSDFMDAIDLYEKGEIDVDGRVEFVME